MPKTISAGEASMSSLWAARMPSNTHGSWSVQDVPISRAMREALSWRWKCSTRPLDCRWYAVVRCSVVPRDQAMSVQSWEINWGPRLEMISPGTPNRETHWTTNALATEVVSIDVSGIASGQREKRSTTVRRWVKP